MKKILLAGAAMLAAVAAAQPASATIYFSFTTAVGNDDPGYGANDTLLYDFSTLVPVDIEGDYAFRTGSLGGIYSEPLTTTPGGTYLAVPADQNPDVPDQELPNSAVLGLGEGRNQISFYWGSIDGIERNNNVLEVLDVNGEALTINGLGLALTGADILAITGGASGSQSDPLSNGRLKLWTDDPSELIYGLRFSSKRYAFETDTYVFGAVPEPSAWAMMLVGFGAVGYSLRRRKSYRLLQAV